jgi:hypothetical protein
MESIKLIKNLTISLQYYFESAIQNWKINFNPWHDYAGTEARRTYCSNPFATQHWKEVGGQNHATAAFPGKDMAPFLQDVVWA